MNYNYQDLDTRVIAAFDGWPYPGDNNILCDDYGGVMFKDQSLIRWNQALEGKHWRDVELIVFQVYYTETIRYFTPDAFGFYLPTYLIGSLHWDEAHNDSTTPETVVSVLNPPTSHRFLAYTENLTNGQNQVILEFLQAMNIMYSDNFQDDGIEEAIEIYWSNPIELRSRLEPHLFHPQFPLPPKNS